MRASTRPPSSTTTTRPATRGPRAPSAVFTLPALFRGMSTDAKRAEAKADLLASIAPLKRGAAADDAARADVAAKFARLEALNPTPKPLAAADRLSGRWRLLYTTSASILGTTRPPLLRPGGDIYQTIDAAALKAQNRETWPFFNRVDAALTPETASRVFVRFVTFYILGLIPVTAPPTATGKLDITYLDDDLRLSRGDKGNLFVLEMDDRAARL